MFQEVFADMSTPSHQPGPPVEGGDVSTCSTPSISSPSAVLRPQAPDAPAAARPRTASPHAIRHGAERSPRSHIPPASSADASEGPLNLCLRPLHRAPNPPPLRVPCS